MRSRKRKRTMSAEKLKAKYDREHKGEKTITVPHPTMKGTYIQKRI